MPFCLPLWLFDPKCIRPLENKRTAKRTGRFSSLRCLFSFLRTPRPFSYDTPVTAEITWTFTKTCVVSYEFGNTKDWHIDCDLLQGSGDLFVFSVSCQYENRVVLCLIAPHCLSRTVESLAPEELVLEYSSFDNDEGCQLIPGECSIACSCSISNNDPTQPP